MTSRNSSYIKTSPKKNVTKAHECKISQIPEGSIILVWFDRNCISDETNHTTEMQLHELYSTVELFEEYVDFQRFLKANMNKNRIHLILSGQYTRLHLAAIHDLPEIESIFIYCMNVKQYASYKKDFPKVREVLSEPDQLIRAIEGEKQLYDNVQNFTATKIIEPTMMTAAVSKPQQILSVGFHNLLHLLMFEKTIPVQATPEKFLKILENDYAETDGDVVERFKRFYRPEEAVSWLFESHSLKDYLDRATREQNIELLFALRFFLIALYQCIHKNRAREGVAYKIQPMSVELMEEYRASVGQIICSNTALFASKSKERLSPTITQKMKFQPVLIEIDAQHSVESSPFAFLDNFPVNQGKFDANDIIFMCGSMFLIKSFAIEGNFWTLKLELAPNRIHSQFNLIENRLMTADDYSTLLDLFIRSGDSKRTYQLGKEILDILPSKNNAVELIRNKIAPYGHSTAPVEDVFILFNLDQYMNSYAESIVKILKNHLKNGLVLINQPVSSEMLDEWSTSNKVIFTSASDAKLLKKFFSQEKVIEMDEADHSEGLKPINLFMAKLVDLIVDTFKKKIQKLEADGAQKEEVNILRCKCSLIHQDYMTNAELASGNAKSFQEIENIAPIVFWLKCSQSTEPDLVWFKTNFQDQFGDIVPYTDVNRCHEAVVLNENQSIILIADERRKKEDIECFHQFKNILHIYGYKLSQGKTEMTKFEQDDFSFVLLTDLTKHYESRAKQYSFFGKHKDARDCFLKAKELCDLLSEKLFS